MKSFDQPMIYPVDTQSIASAQAGYCNDHDYPLFAPYNGRCYNCGRDIYAGEYGFSIEFAKNNLVSHCPYCHYSFVD